MGVPRTQATVATLVRPRDRVQLDAAADRAFAPWHADSVPQVLRAVRERPLHAVLVSPSCVRREQLHQVATLVSGFPGVPTVALVSEHDRRSSQRLLELGAYGVRWVLDLSARDGWDRLRALVGDPATPTASRMLARIIPALGETPPDCRQFFEILARLSPGLTSVRALTRQLRVPPSTFVSRFLRARLPSPKRYLSGARLVHAAAVLEAPALSIADVAHRLEYSSPQSFGRHLRTAMGLTAGEFRRRFDFAAALEDFVTRLIDPYRSHLRGFHPLDYGVGDPGQEP